MASKTEIRIYKFLDQFDLPFVCNEARLPVKYKDKSDKELIAKSDAHLPIFGKIIHFEIKDSTFNNKTSKATADKALARLDPAQYTANPTYYQVVHGWNHAASKFSLVAKAMSAANEYLMLIFDKQPKKTTKACDTPALITKYEINYSTKENFQRNLARTLFSAMPPSPPRADHLANFHTIDSLVPLKSGEISNDLFSILLKNMYLNTDYSLTAEAANAQ